MKSRSTRSASRSHVPFIFRRTLDLLSSKAAPYIIAFFYTCAFSLLTLPAVDSDYNPLGQECLPDRYKDIAAKLTTSDIKRHLSVPTEANLHISKCQIRLYQASPGAKDSIRAALSKESAAESTRVSRSSGSAFSILTKLAQKCFLNTC